MRKRQQILLKSFSSNLYRSHSKVLTHLSVSAISGPTSKKLKARKNEILRVKFDRNIRIIASQKVRQTL